MEFGRCDSAIPEWCKSIGLNEKVAEVNGISGWGFFARAAHFIRHPVCVLNKCSSCIRIYVSY